MARRGGSGGRNPSSRPDPSSGNLSSDFWKSFGASNPDGTTPSTPSTPSTSSGPRKTRWAQDLDSRQDARDRVDRNLELAYQGDDSELLPYRPTNTINPRRPRTLAAGYDNQNQKLFVRFRDGEGYEYHNVTRAEWREFKSTPSPGRYINRILNHHLYNPADW